MFIRLTLRVHHITSAEPEVYVNVNQIQQFKQADSGDATCVYINGLEDPLFVTEPVSWIATIVNDGRNVG